MMGLSVGFIMMGNLLGRRSIRMDLRDLGEAYKLLSKSNVGDNITIVNMRTGEVYSNHEESKTDEELRQIMADAGFTVFKKKETK